MAVEEILPELPWLLTLICFAGIIIMIAMCVCAKHTEKVQEYGTAGRLSLTRDSPIFHHPTSNGNIFTVKPLDQDCILEDGTLKRNSWTVKDRALPDIPHGSSVSNANLFPNQAAEENHVVIEDSNFKRKTHNKPVAPKPPADDVSSKESSSVVTKEAPHIMKITVNDKPLSKEENLPRFNARPRTQIIDSIPGTSATSVVLKKVEKAVSTSSPIRRVPDSDAQNYGEANHYAEPQIETLPVSSSSPVCIRIVAPPTPEVISATTPAGLAVAGAVPSSDIPYMTPPVLHTTPTLQNSEVRPQESMNSPIHRSEVPYTVISVREPLAKVREMTFRKQRMVQQRSDDGENQYTMVPEEEQMYAEIGSGQDSGSSSITYAHIEPRELPPVPPTVESLKSVAHAHSRQASTVSTSSFGSCLSSAENTSPPALRNPSTSLYSAVDKHPKQRKTIHVAEGASIISSIEKHKNVEDLYAKVRKKRVDLTVGIPGPEKYSNYQEVSGNDSECLTPPPSPWASTTPPAPPPITGRLQAASLGVLSSTNFQHVRRHSADPNLPEKVREAGGSENKQQFSHAIVNKPESEPGYEQIYNEDENADDSCYEKIKDDMSEPKSQVGYASVGSQDADQNSLNFTCYEIVKDMDKDSSDPGYECVTQLGGEGSSSDPGYEPVRISSALEDSDSNHGYTTVDLGDESEPNYETVKKISRTESDAVDPGYEKVKKIHRNDSDATDPGYEKVKNKMAEELADPGYETVQRSDSDTEPGYETVRHQKGIGGKCSQTSKNKPESNEGHSSLNYKSNNSTILFVSGNSSHYMKQLEPKSKESSDDSSFECEGNATFL